MQKRVDVVLPQYSPISPPPNNHMRKSKQDRIEANKKQAEASAQRLARRKEREEYVKQKANGTLPPLPEFIYIPMPDVGGLQMDGETPVNNA
jgi:hypothetical protein